MQKPWLRKEIEFIRDNYSDMPTSEISDKLGRSQGDIRARASYLGVKKYKLHKDPDFISYMREHYPTVRNSRIAKKFDTTKSLIFRYANNMGLKKKPNRQEKLDYIKANYNSKSRKNIAKKLGITPGTLSVMASEVGVAKHIRDRFF